MKIWIHVQESEGADTTVSELPYELVEMINLLREPMMKSPMTITLNAIEARLEQLADQHNVEWP